MNIKELKESIKDFPDDMEVFVYEEVAGFVPLVKPEITEIEETEHEDYRQKGKTYRAFGPPINFDRVVIRRFKGVLLNYY